MFTNSGFFWKVTEDGLTEGEGSVVAIPEGVMVTSTGMGLVVVVTVALIGISVGAIVLEMEYDGFDAGVTVTSTDEGDGRTVGVSVTKMLVVDTVGEAHTVAIGSGVMVTVTLSVTGD